MHQLCLRPFLSGAVREMYPGESPERYPPDARERAITRDLWLVRDKGDANAGLPDRLGEAGDGRGFEWIGVPAEHAKYASPAVTAKFQQRLRDASIRSAEVRVEQEEEELRTSRETNRLNEKAFDKQIKQGSRSSAVRFLRSVVILMALIWMLVILGLSSVGSPAAGQITPGAVIRYATKLIDGVEAAIGVRHTPRHEPAARLA